MITIGSNTIGNTAPISGRIFAMEKAFFATSEGRIEVPQQVGMQIDEDTILRVP